MLSYTCVQYVVLYRLLYIGGNIKYIIRIAASFTDSKFRIGINLAYTVLQIKRPRPKTAIFS